MSHDVSFTNTNSNITPQELGRQLGNKLSHPRRRWRERVIIFNKSNKKLILYNLYTNREELVFNFSWLTEPSLGIMESPKAIEPNRVVQLNDGCYFVTSAYGLVLEFSTLKELVHRYEFVDVLAIYELENRSIAISNKEGIHLVNRETKSTIRHIAVHVARTTKLFDGTFVISTPLSDIERWDGNFETKLATARLNTTGGLCGYSLNHMVRSYSNRSIDLYSFAKDDTEQLLEHTEWVSQLIPVSPYCFLFIDGYRSNIFIYNHGEVHELPKDLLFTYENHVLIVDEKVIVKAQDSVFVYNTDGKKDQEYKVPMDYRLLAGVLE